MSGWRGELCCNWQQQVALDDLNRVGELLRLDTMKLRAASNLAVA